jgi:hypothetical protein
MERVFFRETKALAELLSRTLAKDLEIPESIECIIALI